MHAHIVACRATSRIPRTAQKSGAEGRELDGTKVPRWMPPYRLYVVEFFNGVIKAGITAGPEERRIAAHRSRWPIRRHQFTSVVSGFSAEAELLRRCGRIGSVIEGKEWFTGVRFEQAVQLADQIARRAPGAGVVGSRPPHIRDSITKLSFSDAEIEVMRAYSLHVGKPLSVACRELAMECVIEQLDSRVHGNESSLFLI